MESQGKTVIYCPSCRTRYRVSEYLAGRTVACRKCGGDFKVAFGDSADPHGKPVSPEEAFEVSVSDDELQAYIQPKTDDLSNITVDQIKKKLEALNVTYGVLDDDQIRAFLKNGPHARMPFKIAQGKVPVTNADESLQLYFPARRLEVIAPAEMGASDSDDRPVMHRVKKGDLIAQREVPLEGNIGVNVFGETVVLSGHRGMRVPRGQGTEISDDGLRLFADIDGIPDVTIDGRIRVLPELRIQGDVNFKTGPIDFDGYIVVQGEMRSGLSIRGCMLVAREIQKAEIDVEGDVVVAGGVIGAHVRAGGNVRVKFVKNAVIEALGDVFVQREVYDSRITACGKVKTENGRILSSRISAKKGIEAVDIGSVPSKPCDLHVGIDELTENEVRRTKNLISEKEEWIRGEYSLLTRLEQQALILARKIDATSRALEEGKAELEHLDKKLAQAKLDELPLQVTRLQEMAAELEKKLIRTEKILESLGRDREQLADRIDERQEELAYSEKRVEELQDRCESILDWSSAQSAHPHVIVSGEIFARTSIQGPHTSVVIKKDEKNVVIRETNVSKSVYSDDWTFFLSPLK